MRQRPSCATTRVTEIPSPPGLAPFSIALAATCRRPGHGADSDLGTGRFILLYDPNEPEAWGGPFRVVCFAQAPLETEIGVDPFVADVTWCWLVDALEPHGASTTTPRRAPPPRSSRAATASSPHRATAPSSSSARRGRRRGADLAAHVEAWRRCLHARRAAAGVGRRDPARPEEARQ